MSNKLKAFLTVAVMLLVIGGCKRSFTQIQSADVVRAEVQEMVTQIPEETPVEEKSKPKVEIEIPQEQDLVTDYTTIEGLTLEAGAHIAIVVKEPKSNYWKAVEKGIKQAVADLNQRLGYTGSEMIYYTYEGPDDGDSSVQINTIDAVLAENPQVLCLSAIDMNSCEAQLETAQENGIPVVVLDSGVTSDELVYTVCETDNYRAGVKAARKIAGKIAKSGKVQIVAHQQNAETTVNREQGFRDEMAKSYPDIEVLETIYEDGEERIADRMHQVLQENPDLKGCFTTSESTGVKVLRILAKQKAETVQQIGFDAGETQLQAIRSGAMAGIVCQNPNGMGYAAIVAGCRAILGLENDRYINAGYQWIDADNIDAQENQKYLYQ